MKRLLPERLLARMFFGRFFESELLPPGLPHAQLLIWGIASMTAPGYLLSLAFAFDYGRIPRARLRDVVPTHQLMFVLIGMVALGALALAIWEGVFPDRRDVRILGVLPLSNRTQVLARLGALSAVAGLFCFGVNVPSAVVYGFTLWGNGLTPDVWRPVLAHLVATSLGGVFMFSVLITAQGAILTVYGRRTAHRLSLLLQVVFVVVLLQAAVYVPALGARMQGAFRGQPDGIVAFVPPVWFLALYNVLAGTGRSDHLGYALVGLVATLVGAAVGTTLIAGSYPRLVRMALETGGVAPTGRARPVWRLCRRVTGRVVKSDVGRAVAEFTVVTFARSRTHLTLLATYVGVAIAVVLSATVPLFVKGGTAAFATPTAALLAVPLVINFFVLCGMRTLAALPTDIKANWAFRLYAPDDLKFDAIDGVRTAFLIAAVAPIAIIAGTIGLLLWGVRVGLLHGLFTGAAGLLLVDLLLVGVRKIPFTCTYYPGRARARTMWPFYGIAFIGYSYGLATLEAMMLARSGIVDVVAFAVVAVGLTVGFAYGRRHDLHGPPGLTYDEQDPDAMFEGFKLSEGVAAERVGLNMAVRAPIATAIVHDRSRRKGRPAVQRP